MELCVLGALIQRGSLAELSLTQLHVTGAALDCLPVAHSSRVSAESPPPLLLQLQPSGLPSGAWTPYSLDPLALTTCGEAEGLLFLGVGTLLSGHRKLCELLCCPSGGTLGLQTAPPRVVAHTVGHQQPVWGPRCCRDPCLAPRFLEEKPHQQLKWVSGGRDAVGPREEVMASLGGEDEPTEE